ncbi:winged helix-turn-helix domain-containing protein [Actinacidiphila soli]|uniref:winged helix-turn-helix domain-containing protein n=1 Tax=Actinacidiphila soli TaxID=2487275 RepID=UPI0013E3F0E1|nr:winged helix-turn-helix domain-containing protein [Actinacidiphila soli]
MPRAVVRSHPQWSDRVIASLAGLTGKTVGALRRHASEEDTGEAQQAQSRIGDDGRVRPLDSSHGRRAAERFITENPGASLREIARESGISPGTVRDVRDRMRRGENPVLHRRAPRSRPPAPTATTTPSDAATGSMARSARTAFFGNLYRDPSLRLTENGRLLLRLLEVHSVASAQWDSIIDSVPAHCAETVLAAAAECADAWQELP